MNTKGSPPRPFVLCAALAAALLANALHATPGSGVVSSAVARAATDFRAIPTGNGVLLAAASGRELVDLLFVTVTFAPGGYAGWHSHPGPGFLMITQGTLTVEHEEGCPVEYPQGSVFYESGHVHNAYNATAGTVVIRSVFYVPTGSALRVDAPVTVGDGDCATPE